MTPPFSARRRADEFEALLSRGPDAPLTERDAAQFAALLEVVSDLRALPDVAPRAEFTSSLRERLMAEADTVLVSQPAAPQRLALPATSRSRNRRLGALLGGAALVGTAATMAVASQTALPGESLYGVKRGIESAEVRLAPDDAARGRTLLAQADTRLTELEELAAGEVAGREELIPDTLDSFTQQSTDGVRSLIDSYESGGSDREAQAARDFTARSMERLDELQGQVPESAREQLVAAGLTLSDLDQEVSSVCVSCAGGITVVPDFLLTSAPQDLMSGLDVDGVQLEGAPISGQDLTGITVPQALAPEQVLPTKNPTPGLPTPSSLAPTQNQAPSPTPTPTQPVKPSPTSPVKDVTQDVTQDITKGLDDTVTTVTNTTSDLASQLNGVTGGALGGLTSGVDNATGGLIGEVTGTLDGATGGLLGNATGGLLPGTGR
ncbi:hypothetical protein F4692_002027 [Nocardioides cavernae]|uniref:DUF5667 domain-containing protein n=1 Tax=Nocardioides cavernae TaxID=1921566 RepID=A0A7Y9H479_9ACTN|nr:DUF5667 domain-containing protein [Nocardioides cavernae]NYE36894.1 hypothetical protein [Nocardioides cavernae]